MFLQWEKPPGPVNLSDYAWPPWYSQVTAFRKRNLGKAIWQLANTFVPYLLLWWLIIRFVRLGHSWVLVLPLAVLAAGFLDPRVAGQGAAHLAREPALRPPQALGRSGAEAGRVATAVARGFCPRYRCQRPPCQPLG
jgi:hypothetical protein